MASIKVNVVVSKTKTIELELPKNATLLDLNEDFHSASPKHYPHRQCFKLKIAETGGGKDKKGPLFKNLDGGSKPLSELGVKTGTELVFKDLGPQIGYRTVFLWEYFGPLAIVLLYALRPALIYGEGANATPWSREAMIGVVCWSIHFLKREFETVFVHRFSRPTMPLTNLFKNSIYYWTFGLMIGYPLCHPEYTPVANTLQFNAGVALFAVSELGNFICHMMLRNLRPKEGSTKRPIPKGFLFDFVSCPNYTFEVLGWVAFSMFSQIFFCYLFTAVGFLQMWDWAVKKHRMYLKTYGDEYKKLARKPIVPFVC